MVFAGACSGDTNNNADNMSDSVGISASDLASTTWKATGSGFKEYRLEFNDSDGLNVKYTQSGEGSKEGILSDCTYSVSDPIITITDSSSNTLTLRATSYNGSTLTVVVDSVTEGSFGISAGTTLTFNKQS